MRLARGAALVVGGICIAYCVALSGTPRAAAFFAGAAAVGVIVAVLKPSEGAIGAAMSLIAIAYVFGLLRSGESLDVGAALFALGLLLFGEMLDLARAGGEGRVTERDVWRGRILFLLATIAAGGVVAMLALLFGGSVRVSGPILLFVATTAALTALFLIVRLVRTLLVPEEPGAPGSGGR